MGIFEDIVGQKTAERNAEQDYDREVKKAKAESKGDIKLNLGDVILAFFGLPPLVSMTKNLKEGGAAAALGGMTGIPVLGDVLGTVLKTKNMVPDLLDEAIKATDSQAPDATLDKVLGDIKPLNKTAESAAKPISGVDLSQPTGGSETLNDFFRLLRAVK